MTVVIVIVCGSGQTMRQGVVFKVPDEVRVLSEAGAERGQDVIMGIRPEDLKDIRFPGREGLPKVSAKVEVVESMGSEIFVYVVVGGKTLTARMDPRSHDIQPGQTIQVAVDTHHVHLFDPKTEKALVSRGAPAATVPAVAEAPAPAR